MPSERAILVSVYAQTVQHSPPRNLTQTYETRTSPSSPSPTPVYKAASAQQLKFAFLLHRQRVHQPSSSTKLDCQNGKSAQ